MPETLPLCICRRRADRAAAREPAGERDHKYTPDRVRRSRSWPLCEGDAVVVDVTRTAGPGFGRGGRRAADLREVLPPGSQGRARRGPGTRDLPGDCRGAPAARSRPSTGEGGGAVFRIRLPLEARHEGLDSHRRGRSGDPPVPARHARPRKTISTSRPRRSPKASCRSTRRRPDLILLDLISPTATGWT